MRFGINLLNFGLHATPASFRRWARFAEDTGYHFLMISDHVAVTPDVATQYPAPFYDPFIVLAWMAAVTERLELGTTVTILPYRHPLQTSRIAAGIDQLSAGRFILGIGAGWAREEFEALGVPFAERGARTSEYLAAIRHCWTTDVASFDGRFVSFRAVHTAPRPVRRPHPPIWVGGSSEAAMRRAASLGDGWHPIQFRIEWVRDHGLPRLRHLAETAGREVPAFCPRIRLQVCDSPLAEDGRLPGCGTLDQIRRDLDLLGTLGAEYVLFDSYAGTPASLRPVEADVRTLDAVAEHVLDLARGGVR